MKITKRQLKKIIKEELAEATSRIVSPMTGEEHWVEDPGWNNNLSDFWMSELNSALLASMDNAGVGNSTMPSKFLEALLPVLETYGVGAQAQEMIEHVRNNQNLYSPRRPR
jgi:hypothetical protein